MSRISIRALLCSVIGPENSCHSLNQSHAKRLDCLQLLALTLSSLLALQGRLAAGMTLVLISQHSLEMSSTWLNTNLTPFPPPRKFCIII